jgi:SAM-dependent methyltransferase
MEQDRDAGEESAQSGYDPVAAEYAQEYLHEFDHKPFDRALLERFAARLAGRGQVCDLGCGPGQVAAYLTDRGAHALGIDLSPAMVEQARRANPGIEFRQGDMRALRLEDASLAGIAAFYSLVHIPQAELTGVFRELHRVLQPGGLLLVSFHIGEETIHLDEWWGKPVSLDFHFFRTERVAVCLEAAGFRIDEVLERPPYPDVEHQSRRAYILASKPL